MHHSCNKYVYARKDLNSCLWKLGFNLIKNKHCSCIIRFILTVESIIAKTALVLCLSKFLEGEEVLGLISLYVCVLR